MKRYFTYINLILVSIVFPDEVTLTTLTPFFTVDTEAPSAEWIYPSGENEFDDGLTCSPDYIAEFEIIDEQIIDKIIKKIWSPNEC